MTRSLIALAGSMALVAPIVCNGTALLLESDADRNAGNEIYGLSYGTRADMFGNVIGAQDFSQLDVNPQFTSHDFANDGRMNLLLESDLDRGAGNEVYLVQYAAFADFAANVISQQFFLPLDVNPLFSIAGFTYANGSYQLLLESDADRGAGNEVYFLQYDSFADLTTNTISSQFYLPLDLNPLFSIGGFGYANGAYQLLLESRADRSAGNEVYFLEYNTFADMLTNTIGSQSFLPLDINPLFSIRGFEGDFASVATPPGTPPGTPPVSVSEPASWACIVLCLGVFGTMRRRSSVAPMVFLAR